VQETKKEEAKPIVATPAEANKPINKEAQKELQKQQRLFQQLEKQVADLNKKKTELEAKLAAPDTYSNPDEFKKTEAAYKAATQQLAAANKEYEVVFEKLMELEGS
jgi:ATP-binding cassette subfamily F protein 3